MRELVLLATQPESMQQTTVNDFQDAKFTFSFLFSSKIRNKYFKQPNEVRVLSPSTI